MSTPKTERLVYPVEFLISEARGTRSREVGTVKSGENLKAGTIVALDTAKLVAWQAGDTAVGIIAKDYDASEADVPDALYIARSAEVDGSLLTYPEDSATEAAADLLALKIVVRPSLLAPVENDSESESASASA